MKKCQTATNLQENANQNYNENSLQIDQDGYYKTSKQQKKKNKNKIVSAGEDAKELEPS